MKMLVKDAIKYLNYLPPEDHIVIAWWDMDDFFGEDNDWFEPLVSKAEWEDVVHIGDDMDWSMTHESLLSVMELEIRANRKRESNETN